MGVSETSFLSGANAEFIAELYSRYLDDPNAVDASWQHFFAGLGDDAAPSRPNGAVPASPDSERFHQAATDSIRALNLIRAYRVRGHLEADLDPLRIERREDKGELDYRSYGFTEADLDR
jgi:2-oxoglutarate dehydrogenase E1 component